MNLPMFIVSLRCLSLKIKHRPLDYPLLNECKKQTMKKCKHDRIEKECPYLYIFSFVKTEYDFISAWTPIGLFC